MVRPRRRQEHRRVPRDRSRPVGSRSFFVASPPEKRVGRIVLGILFLAAAVALVAFGRPPLDIRPGERAGRDYRSRIYFEIEDLEATRSAREQAERRVIRTFADRSDELLERKRDIKEFLQKLASTPPTQALYNEARELWGLAGNEVDALHKGLQGDRGRQITSRLDSLFAEAADRDLWNVETRKQEYGNNRYRIKVIHPGAAEPEERSVWDPIALPEGLESHFSISLGALAVFQDVPVFGQALIKVLTRHVVPTLVLDENRTNEDIGRAGRDVPPERKEIFKDTIILRRGERATEQAVMELRREADVYAREETPGILAQLRNIGATVLIIGVLFAVLGVHIGRHRPDLMRSNNRLFRVGFVGLAVLAIGKAVHLTGLPVVLTPLCGATLIYCIIYGRGFAIGMTALLGIILGLMFRDGFNSVAILMTGGAVGAVTLDRLRRRIDPIRVGVVIGAAQGVMVLAFWLVGQQEDVWSYVPVIASIGSGVAGGVVVGFLLTAFLPVIEGVSGVVTDVTLLEWADQNQPILRKLAIEAPGTYHHSMVVSSLAEAASDAVGGNPFLARAGALLHDVGKMNKPEYFAENVPGDPGKRHRELSPQMSALVIAAHVKDGLELARNYNIPRPIRDIIEQHHGTTLVEYFYRRALEQADGEPVEQDTFRYRGPRPRSKEAGIILLADAVESATRSLADPSPARVDALVQEICRRRLLDSELDESGLTLTDLRKISRSFARTLMAVFHPRVQYPERPNG